MVRVRDGEGAEWEEVDTSCGNCNFQHRFYTTPWIERLEPYAGQPCEGKGHLAIYLVTYIYVQ